MPELWQMMFAPSSIRAFNVPEHLHAMLAYVVEEASRVKWNNEQKEWDVNSSEWVVPWVFAFRPFDWSDHEDEDSELLPNLEFDGVEISFYKRFGRGMTVSREMDERGWRVWFDAFLEAVRKQEKRAY